MTCSALVTAMIISMCTAAVALAQNVRGTVIDSATRQPITGAVVLALDSAGGTRARTISDRLGQYRLMLSRETRSVRALRIGFRPRDVPAPAVGEGTTTLDISMSRLPTLLEPVRVIAGARCDKRSDDEAVFGLLQQARAGLLSMVVARESNQARIVRLTFRRSMDGVSERILRQQVRIDSTDHPGPSFRAVRTAAEFVEHGFSDGGQDSQLFFGPDAEILLDDAFRDGYCFSLRRPDASRRGQVGLAFAPASRRAGRVDIDGTLWIDTVARELRDIPFRYLGLARALDAANPGGHIEFRTLANGIVIIDRWFLRLATVATDTVFERGRERVRPGRLVAEETGGEVAGAAWPDGFSWHASLGEFRGYAVDANGKFARGLAIALAETDYRATTNERGEFAIGNLLPGPYTATTYGSALDSLGLALRTSLSFTAYRDSVFDTTLPVQTVEHFSATQCGTGAPPGAKVVDFTSPWLLGRLLTFDGKPVSGVVVSLSRQSVEGEWLAFGDRVRTGSDGLFAYCSRLPTGKRIQIEVRRDTRLIHTLQVELGEPATVKVVRVEVPANR